MTRKLNPLSALFLACVFAGFSTTSAFATESVLYAFKGGTDGSNPVGGLIAVGGKFYGMTAGGGTSGFGTIFSLTPDGVKTTLYSFAGGADGETPTGGLDYVGGKFYGNTSYGGNGANCNGGCGTIFSITPSGNETVLAVFTATGTSPQLPNGSGLVDIGDKLYGVSEGGGTGGGTVFSVTLNGTLNVFYSFGKKFPNDGALPLATPTKIGGVLYGTTFAGGGRVESGAIYSITPKGKETVLHIFQEPKLQGFSSRSRLAYLGDRLYGTLSEGGPNNGGAFFRYLPTGETRVLYAFGAPGDGTDPLSVTRVNRTFYGAANGGGSSGNGMLFVITEKGVETQLYSFAGDTDASAPNSRLLNVNGTFYGTSTSGGGSAQCKGGCGTVFSYTP